MVSVENFSTQKFVFFSRIIWTKLYCSCFLQLAIKTSVLENHWQDEVADGGMDGRTENEQQLCSLMSHKTRKADLDCDAILLFK